MRLTSSDVGWSSPARRALTGRRIRLMDDPMNASVKKSTSQLRRQRSLIRG